MLALVLRTTEFVFYHLLLSLVDRVSRLPRDTTVPEAMRLYRLMGRGAEAESLHMNALGLSIEVNGPKNPNVAIFSRDLAVLLAEQQRYAESEEYFKAALHGFTLNYGPTHREVRQTYMDYGKMLAAAGRQPEADHFFARAAGIDD